MLSHHIRLTLRTTSSLRVMTALARLSEHALPSSSLILLILNPLNHNIHSRKLLGQTLHPPHTLFSGASLLYIARFFQHSRWRLLWWRQCVCWRRAVRYVRLPACGTRCVSFQSAAALFSCRGTQSSIVLSLSTKSTWGRGTEITFCHFFESKSSRMRSRHLVFLATEGVMNTMKFVVV